MARPETRLVLLLIGGIALWANPALAQEGSLLTNLENEIATAAQGWETTILDAARSLFWILAGIEVGIAAVWLAISAASLDTWFAELVRRIMFIGLFVFILEQGPDFAKAVVDSLFQIGAGAALSRANFFVGMACLYFGASLMAQLSEHPLMGFLCGPPLALLGAIVAGLTLGKRMSLEELTISDGAITHRFLVLGRWPLLETRIERDATAPYARVRPNGARGHQLELVAERRRAAIATGVTSKSSGLTHQGLLALCGQINARLRG